MGHSDISSTQIYAKITDKKISEDMDRLIERRQKKQINRQTNKQLITQILPAFSNSAIFLNLAKKNNETNMECRRTWSILVSQL